jgi:thioredoxin-like negative regulator of GroEL
MNKLNARAALALGLFALGCQTSPTKQESPVTASAARAACARLSDEEPRGALRWFHDDYAGALACARERGLPLVVDMWAPWCHTCLSMKHYVLTDPGLAPLAERFVWLALDTDREENAAALQQLPVRTLPTFFVLSPDQQVQARYLGAASISQLRDFLLQGERGHFEHQLEQGQLDPGSPLVLLRAAERAAIAGDLPGAELAYQRALSAAPPGWPRRPDVLVARIGCLYKQERYKACVALGLEAMEQTGSSASAADFAYYASACAAKLQDDVHARALRERAVARLTPLVADLAAPLSVDDRSDALRILREITEQLGDQAGARALAERQMALLDQAAAAAPTPLAAMTYNWPRAEVYVYLGRGAELLPALERSAAALPEEYDPPYRLAWVLHKLGEHERALVSAQRAQKLAYGPRKARVLWMIADLHAALEDRVAAREVMQQVVELYRSLPPGQQQPAALERAQAALVELAP